MAKLEDTAAINLRLGLLGITPPTPTRQDEMAASLVQPVLARQRELNRRLSYRLPAVDGRIQAFLDAYLEGTGAEPQLPNRTLALDQAGLARAMSLPKDGDYVASEHLTSYRLVNGVLHNPTNDRRTTKGVFHIAEGGLPIQDDKIAVPREVYGRILEAAMQPPADAMVLPYGANFDEPPRCWVSLQLRPVVVPAVPGYTNERTIEVRFFAPASLIANLDFVEGIFGNGGDPYLPENDASLDPAHWTGTTGAVILAPHLTKLRKKDLGLPHYDDATERQRRDGQCWSDEDELYNGGTAFKVCARDERGVIVTVIADNYFGYCKKEVKAQISYSANLLGLVEEEHAGGAVCLPRYNQGQTYVTPDEPGYQLSDVVARDPQRFLMQPEGHALDAELENVVLVPAGARFSLRDSSISWGDNSIRLRADRRYLTPDGNVVELLHQDVDGSQWSIVSFVPNPTQCHKPATVSGGGKSEISKAITDAFIHGDAYTPNYVEDMEQVAAIIERDYTERFIDPVNKSENSRPLLSDRRSVGSVIKLLTPSADYTDEYNAWVERIPNHIKELVFVVKRFYRPKWGSDWASHFSVGRINGRHGVSLRLDGQKIQVNMLRVGYGADGSWRLFGLRHDFQPSEKVQTEDDITASVVVPAAFNGREDGLSRKYVTNCESLLFQRPDEAIHRGYDKQAEADIASPGTFLSNFEPLTREDAQAFVEDAVAFSSFSGPMRALIAKMASGEAAEADYFVSSAHPRIVNGARSKNPRYLQLRPDISNPQATATVELAIRVNRKLPMSAPLRLSVDVVAAGRRNSPPEETVPALCAYAPLHYMELPELFMEFISSMTGKSPSTTGAGSEGAMTKGPFNPLPSVIDLNAALLSFVLTGYDGWLSSAGTVGPNVRVDHDISLLIPEVFSRMSDDERDARHLAEEGSLELVPDFEYEGRMIPGSRLGYRMTEKFMTKYFGRIFMHPHVVFSENMLRPELQDLTTYVDSIDTIVATHERVAQSYFDDGTVALAIPPIRILLGIMAQGSYEGYTLDAPEFRGMFTRESVLASDWYAERVQAAREEERRQARNSIAAMERFIGEPKNAEAAERLRIAEKLQAARAVLDEDPENARRRLVGTLGRQTVWHA